MEKYPRYKRVVNNKLPYFGDIDEDKKVITINKKIHEKAKKKGIFGIPKKDSTIINTIVHEEKHRLHPRMHEKTVRKETQKDVKKLSQKQKHKLYARYQ